jgi:spermidine synthase
MNPTLLFEGNTIEIYQEGPELVAKTKGKGLEYSRLNLQTNKATHWYARTICDRILSRYPKKEQPLRICCLGTSMGAIPYELLHSYPKAKITCVDIDAESLYILKHSILKSFGSRVHYKEMDAKDFLKTVEPNTFDIVINDLFSEDESPEFINTEIFLQTLWTILKSKGLYFANTYTDRLDLTHGSLLEERGFHVKRYSMYPTGKTNVIYEAGKA